MTYKTPDWYNTDQLTKAVFAEGYSGWVIDLGDGTCRFANQPLLGEDGPNWGDKCWLIADPFGGRPTVDSSEILERYDREIDRIN